MERLIRRRKECPEIGWGHFEVVEAKGPILAHRCDWHGETVIAVHNLSDKPASVHLPAEDHWEELIDLLGGQNCEPGAEMKLNPYGYRWLRPHLRGQPLPP
jgi:maltose alpha-D-glucosyltransferase/alpha-amylase